MRVMCDLHIWEEGTEPTWWAALRHDLWLSGYGESITLDLSHRVLACVECTDVQDVKKFVCVPVPITYYAVLTSPM